MSHRLQVLLDERDMEGIREIACRNKLTVAEWVRQVLRRARREEPLREAHLKLEAVRKASTYSYPTADIDQMLAEVERGYLE